MLQLVSPVSLAALVALLVPVAIHLWSRGAGRRLQVGSLRFLEDTERRRLRAVKLTELPLLLLRLGLLALLVGLLAGPVWIERVPQRASAPRHLVLVHPALEVGPAARAPYQVLDSLARAGASLHRLAPGLPRFEVDDPPRDRPGPVPDVWSLLREADQGLPPGSRLTVVGPNLRSGFRGRRPALGASVAWVTVSPEGRNRWIDAARWIDADSLAVTVGESEASASWYVRHRLLFAGQRRLVETGGMAFEVDPAGEVVRLLPPDSRPGDDTLRIAPASPELRVLLIHSPARRDDARYVGAAFGAVAAEAAFPLSIRTGTTFDDEADERVDWVFWLHEDPVPPELEARVPGGLHLVSDAGMAPALDVERWMVVEEGVPGEPIQVRRRVPPQRRGVAFWRDSMGEALLERESQGQGTHDRFYSRFHPSWSTLVLNPAFAAWVATLLVPLRPDLPDGDVRRISTAQRDTRLQAEAGVVAVGPEKRPLHRPLWMLALLLFAVERWSAHRRRR